MAKPENIATRRPDRPGMVTLSGGHSISEAEARKAGFTVLSEADAEAQTGTAARKAALSDVAIRLPGMPGRVRVPGYGTTSDTDARARGLRVMTEAEADAAAAQAKVDARREAFLDLPEARGKVRSAMRLASNHPELSAEQARSFLRGAPTDAALTAQGRAPQPTATAPAVDLTTNGDRTMSSRPIVDKEARRAELANVMRGIQGARVSLRTGAEAPAPTPQPVDKEARKAELAATMKGVLGQR